jgi:predicted RNA-binding protein with TRAM domain
MGRNGGEGKYNNARPDPPIAEGDAFDVEITDYHK